MQALNQAYTNMQAYNKQQATSKLRDGHHVPGSLQFFKHVTTIQAHN